MTLVHNAVHDPKSPKYLRELLTVRVPPRALRSCAHLQLVETKANRKTYGDRAFQVNGPKEFNKLPSHLRDCEDIKVFKGLLKTHFFKAAYKEYI